MFIPFFLDPRLKVFVERKVYGELRAWFDSRLEDAFKAAEEEENGDDEDEDESGEEVLSSDEDDIDQDGQDYLERLQVLIIIGFVLFQEILPHTWISGTNF